MKKCLLSLAVMLCFLPTSFSATLYVDANVEGGAQNGSSWANAFPTLSAALATLSPNPFKITNDNIWVAAGTYYPTTDTDRSASFVLNKVNLYGGFAGGETELSQRDPELNETILSGDIGLIGDQSDNSYQVIRIVGSCLLDGLTIRDGNASTAPTFEQSLGGGLYFNIVTDLFSGLPQLQLNQCKFDNNQADFGGGAYIVYDADNLPSGIPSTMTIESCSFTNNTATNDGGGLYVSRLQKEPISLDLKNANFQNNRAKRGGGLYSNDTHLNIYRTCFDQNAASQNGLEAYFALGDVLLSNSTFFNRRQLSGLDDVGGIQQIGLIYLGRVKLTVRSATFLGYTAETDALLFYQDSPNTVLITNSILWNGNPTGLLYAGVEDAPLLSGTIRNTVTNQSLVCVDDKDDGIDICPVITLSNITTSYPEFVDSSTGDLRLNLFSPVINLGDNTLNTATTDKAGDDRIYQKTIDPGAYEFNGTSIALTIPTSPAQSVEADGSYAAADGWTHYYHSAQRLLLLSVKTGGQDIGNPGINNFSVQITTTGEFGSGARDLSQATYLQNVDRWFVMQRYWQVLNATTPAHPVALRFYFLDEEVDAIRKAITDLGGAFEEEDLFLYKVSGPGKTPHSTSVTNEQFAQYALGDTPSLNNWTGGRFNGIRYAEFLVDGFSGGSAGGTPDGQAPLPVELLYFTAVRSGDDVQLNWATASEVNNDYFRVERSADGQQFFPLAQIDGAGTSLGTLKYTYLDRQSQRGVNYYRLRQVDFDGSFEYSPVVSVDLSHREESLFLFPNPGIDAVKLQLPEVFQHQPATIQVYNMMGQQMLEFEVASADSQLLPIRIDHFSPGTYLVVAQNEFFFFSRRFTVRGL